ncbi:hypothetical protein [Nocardia fusca]|uniref:hypothetical protein n=1 Tax=Nocardia fusca TaxID=941183 RepID=UPI0007A753A9|nr:hypothetical protein [Nocardia fusca]
MRSRRRPDAPVRLYAAHANQHRPTTLSLAETRVSLHPTAAAAIAAAHLSGNPPRHRNRPRTAPIPEQIPAPPVVEPINLDPGYYDRGVAAR